MKIKKIKKSSRENFLCELCHHHFHKIFLKCAATSVYLLTLSCRLLDIAKNLKEHENPLKNIFLLENESRDQEEIKKLSKVSTWIWVKCHFCATKFSEKADRSVCEGPRYGSSSMNQKKILTYVLHLHIGIGMSGWDAEE